MAPELRDLHWLAGLLEGEGCFRFDKRTGDSQRYASDARISLRMTDRDVVDRARMMMAPFTIGGTENPPNRKTIFSAAISGARAVGWMMTLYPMMGARRQRKIREVLALWKSDRPKKFHQRPDGLCRVCVKEPVLKAFDARKGRPVSTGKCRSCRNAHERSLKRQRPELRMDPILAADGRERARQKLIARNLQARERKLAAQEHGAQTSGRRR